MHEMRQAVLGQRQGRPCHKVHLANHKDKQLSGFSSLASSQLATLENPEDIWVLQTPHILSFHNQIICYLPAVCLISFCMSRDANSSFHTLLEIFHHPSNPTLEASIHSSVHQLLSSPQGVRAYPHPHGPEAGESRQFARSHARMTSISICI